MVDPQTGKIWKLSYIVIFFKGMESDQSLSRTRQTPKPDFRTLGQNVASALPGSNAAKNLKGSFINDHFSQDIFWPTVTQVPHSFRLSPTPSLTNYGCHLWTSPKCFGVCLKRGGRRPFLVRTSLLIPGINWSLESASDNSFKSVGLKPLTR